MAQSQSIKDREFSSFVDSPGRPDKSAREVVVANSTPIPISFDQSIAEKILSASDRIRTITWLDFSNKRNRRIASKTYTALSVGPQTLVETFNYSLVSGEYRLDGSSRTLI